MIYRFIIVNLFLNLPSCFLINESKFDVFKIAISLSWLPFDYSLFF
jgi:hypothetical protein